MLHKLRRKTASRRDEFHVFVEMGNNTFVAREVELVGEQGDHVAMPSGLAADEVAVTPGAILLDAKANAAF